MPDIEQTQVFKDLSSKSGKKSMARLKELITEYEATSFPQTIDNPSDLVPVIDASTSEIYAPKLIPDSIRKLTVVTIDESAGEQNVAPVNVLNSERLPLPEYAKVRNINLEPVEPEDVEIPSGLGANSSQRGLLIFKKREAKKAA